MNLKELISIKFVVYIAVTAGLVYLGTSTSDYYKKLEDDQAYLLIQNSIYKRMLSLDPSEKKEYDKLDSDIQELSSKLNYKNAVKGHYDIYWYIVYIVFSTTVLRLIDEKIEKKKIEVNDQGEML